MIPDKGYQFIRRSLCTFNLIFWITGCCLIGLGVWLWVSDYQYFRILPSYHFLSADNVILFCGLMTTFISFLGCCGSWFESKFLLHSYLILILVVMILEILAGSLGYFYRLTLHTQLKSELTIGIKEHYNETNGIAQSWDYLQNNLKCCGVTDHTNWYNIKAWPGFSKIPGSCCIPSKSNSVIYDPRHMPDELHCNIIHTKGCFNEINHWLLNHLYIVGITFIVFGFIQFFCFLISITLICSMKNKSNYSMQNNYKPTYNRVPTLE